MTVAPTLYRTELRSRVPKVALPMFFAHGVKAVKMDAIAEALSISKRTLYELYPTKEDVLLECLVDYSNERMKRMREKAQKSNSVIDVILGYYDEQLRLAKEVNPLFFEEVHKYKKAVDHMMKIHDENNQHARSFFEQGVDEGYFRKDINYDLIIRLGGLTMQTVMQTQMYREYDLSQILNNVNMVFIRGFCTPKGIVELDKHI